MASIGFNVGGILGSCLFGYFGFISWDRAGLFFDSVRNRLVQGMGEVGKDCRYGRLFLFLGGSCAGYGYIGFKDGAPLLVPFMVGGERCCMLSGSDSNSTALPSPS